MEHFHRQQMFTGDSVILGGVTEPHGTGFI